MRSIKNYRVIIYGCSFIPGQLYKLNFPDRSVGMEYIFEFDSIYRDNNLVSILHRNKWSADGVVHLCSGVESLITLPSNENITFKKVKTKVDWDDIINDAY